MGMCTTLSDAGLVSGFFDGLFSLFALIADIFWDVEVYDHCQENWFYDLGFLLGVSTIIGMGFFRSDITALLLIVMLLLYLLGLVFSFFIYIAPVAIVLALAYYIRNKRTTG